MKMIGIFGKIFSNSLFQHLLVWGVTAYILLNIFASSTEIQNIDLLYTAIFLTTIVIPAEINLLILIPRFLQKGRYLLFTMLFAASILGFSYFNQLVFGHLVDLIFPGYYFISYYSYCDIIKFFGIVMGITSLLHLSKDWFSLNQRQQQMALLEKEKITAELKALTNQINPHFLFNSLHLVYAQMISESKQAPETLLKLSEMLRYIIYQSGDNRVELANEVKLMEDYFDIQKLRVPENTNLLFNKSINTGKISVAPMLFLPLIENAFKHGANKEIEDVFVKADLSIDNTKLLFSIENSVPQDRTEDDDNGGGVGLENLKNRLNLIYPDKHFFEVNDRGTTFNVKLEIDLSDESEMLYS